MRRRLLVVAAVGVLGVLLVLVLLPRALDEPVRRIMERNANSRLQGYTIHIGKLRLHPLNFSVELLDSVIVQNEHPDPPMARIPRFLATIHWRALLHRRLVADILFDRLQLHITLPQASQEVRDPTPVEQRGWQEALLAIYPLKVNVLRVREGEVVYVDQGPFRPLHLTRVDFAAENIRNVFSPERVYPSSLRLSAVVFASGHLSLEGHANFLAVPFPGIKGQLALERVELSYFQPLLQRVHLTAKSGTLTTTAEFEYAPSIRTAILQDVAIDAAEVQYSHPSPPATPPGTVREVGKKTAETAKAVSNEPTIQLRLDRLRMTNSSVGYVEEATSPPYLLYVSDLDLTVENLSSRSVDGVATASLRGRFMNSGPASATARLRPRAKQLDLSLDVKIEKTDLARLNNLLRAYGKFDVQSGSFALYSEIRIRDGRIRGYVKPLFQDVHVYAPGKDRHKPLGKRLYERVVGAVSHLLENRPRHEVATVADLAGPVGDARASTLQVVVRLIQNAFFKAILPGFEREIARG